MSNESISNGSSARKSVLVLSASKHLHGRPIADGIKADWAKEKAHNAIALFDNVGFNVDPNDVPRTLKALRKELKGRSWDGIILGWCIRGHVEFTFLFEQIVAVCCEALRATPQTKLMFSTGPDNLVETVLRNFPVEVDGH